MKHLFASLKKLKLFLKEIILLFFKLNIDFRKMYGINSSKLPPFSKANADIKKQEKKYNINNRFYLVAMNINIWKEKRGGRFTK